MKQKVQAYVVRCEGGRLQLLVFKHTDSADAGVQAPAGTVEAGEPLEAALWRELAEESGLSDSDVVLIGKLAEAPEPEYGQVRHIYLLKANHTHLRNQWRIVVTGGGEDNGLVFEYDWADIQPGLRLAGGQDRWLGLISEPLLEDRARS